MIDHTGLSVTDPAVSRRFYEAALAPLGYQVLMEVPREYTGGIVATTSKPAATRPSKRRARGMTRSKWRLSPGPC